MIADEAGDPVEAIKAWGKELMGWWFGFGYSSIKKIQEMSLLSCKARHFRVCKLHTKACVGLELANDK